MEAEIERIAVKDQPGQIVRETPISKITRAKWSGDMAQAVESLLCMPEALSLNLSPTKSRKGRGGRGRESEQRKKALCL
jgi:hypothetical protein